MVPLTRDHTYLSEHASNGICMWSSAKKKRASANTTGKIQLLSGVE